MSVVGFDVGNENCVIAGVKQGVVDVFLNDESKRETPTVVCFGEKQRFLGAAGSASASMNPKSTIYEIKWLIGRKYSDKEVQNKLRSFPFEIRDHNEGLLICLKYLGKNHEFTPVEIMAMVFSHLKEIAEKNLQSPVADCVIGIPSYFSDLQRRAYINASKIAGLNPMRLIHDCTATALSYGIYKSGSHKASNSIVVFVDIGHCDMQVSVVEFERGNMTVLSHAFDSCLGGRDFDEILFRHFATQFERENNVNVLSNDRASIRLRAACQKLKKVLSANTEAPLDIECFIDEKDLKGSIKREEFEKLSENLFKRIEIPCREALDGVKELNQRSISSVELIGSGSRIPFISSVLANVFGREPSRTMNSSECIARGCAIQCAMLSSHVRVLIDYGVRDSFPFHVGISSNQNPNVIFSLGEGELFPCRKALKFIPSKVEENGTFCLDVFYANSNKRSPPVSDPNISSYELQIGPFEQLEENTEIKVTLEIDIHGIIRVLHAKRKGKEKLRVKENIYGGMSDYALSKAIENERNFANQDRDMEQANDCRNILESYVYDTRSKILDTYQSFVDEEDKNRILTSLQKTEEWLYGDGEDTSAESYNHELQVLKKLVDPIENRYKEDKGRDEATQELETVISSCRNFARQLSTNDSQQMINECDRIESWLKEKTEEQMSLPKTVDPLLTVQNITTMKNRLTKVYEENRK